MRIFSVSEVLDDLLCGHIMLKITQGLFLNLAVCQKKIMLYALPSTVTYSNDIPIMVTMGDLVDHQCGTGKLTEFDYFKKQALTKSCHWNYEKESANCRSFSAGSN